jgi:hypothetical protein
MLCGELEPNGTSSDQLAQPAMRSNAAMCFMNCAITSLQYGIRQMPERVSQ